MATERSYQLITSGANRKDARAVEEAARAALAAHSHFRGRVSQFVILATEQTLVIRGAVPSFYLKQLLHSILKDVQGVERVCNQVTVINSRAVSSGEKEAGSTMVANPELEEYRTELRQQVCKHCIARPADAPPCDAVGIGCGIERHLERLIDICRSVDSAVIDPYLERLHDDICADCAYRDRPECPCPLKYLLPLAVAAVETVEMRRGRR